LNALDVAILLGFAAAALALGWRARGVSGENLEQYFLAGRSLSGWSAGVSMAATQFAADTPLLVTGLVATAGIFSLWQLWVYALAFLLLGFVLAPSWRRASVLTDAELAEIRYHGRAAAFLRAAKAIYLGTIFNCTVLAMVLLAAKEIAEPFLLWHAWLPGVLFDPLVGLVRSLGIDFASVSGVGDVWVRSADNVLSVALLLAVTLGYSAMGGLRGVVRTDLLQFSIMMAATAAYAFWVVAEVGGLSAMTDAIRARFADGGPAGMSADQLLAFTPSGAKDASLVVLAVFALQWLVQMNSDGTGYLAQRSMACRSDRDARRAAIVFTVLQVGVRSLLWLPIALALLVLFPPDLSLGIEALRADREGSFVRGIEALPPGLLGLMLTAMLAALASTIDTHLNWGASYWTNDLYARFLSPALLGRRPGARSLVWVARISNLLILALALAIMTQLSSIQSAWRTSLLLGAGLGVLLVLRWLWWRISARGELASILAASVLAPLLLTWPEVGEAERLLWMAVGATGFGVAISILSGPETMEVLVAFYERARPPGFWGPVARAAGVDPAAGPRRLRLGLTAAGLCALSVFCGLTGFGSWLADSPPPRWLPSASLWIASNLLVCAGLVPVWVGLLRRLDEGTSPTIG